jgi:predicted metal-dependent hydrolase
MRMPVYSIQEFIEKHVKWVEKKKAEMRAAAPTLPKQYLPGETFLYLGQAYALEIVKGQKKKLILDDRFRMAETEQERAELVFQNWYRQQAKQLIVERVQHFAEIHQLHYEKITITSARTRWGSCSPKNTISFSWRLIMTPLDVVDYVVVHELAHTVHHNHSKRFWGLVGKILPDYKERRKWLRQYGQEALL